MFCVTRMQRCGEHRSTTFTVPLHRYQEIHRRKREERSRKVLFLLALFVLYGL